MRKSYLQDKSRDKKSEQKVESHILCIVDAVPLLEVGNVQLRFSCFAMIAKIFLFFFTFSDFDISERNTAYPAVSLTGVERVRVDVYCQQFVYDFNGFLAVQ